MQKASEEKVKKLYCVLLRKLPPDTVYCQRNCLVDCEQISKERDW